MFRASRNKTQVGFRLTQVDADALAAVADGESKSSGAYAKQAVLEKVYGGPVQRLTQELRAFRKEVLTRLQLYEKELRLLRAELAAFRKDFLQALPEN